MRLKRFRANTYQVEVELPVDSASLGLQTKHKFRTPTRRGSDRVSSRCHSR